MPLGVFRFLRSIGAVLDRVRISLLAEFGFMPMWVQMLLGNLARKQSILVVRGYECIRTCRQRLVFLQLSLC